MKSIKHHSGQLLLMVEFSIPRYKNFDGNLVEAYMLLELLWEPLRVPFHILDNHPIFIR